MAEISSRISLTPKQVTTYSHTETVSAVNLSVLNGIDSNNLFTQCCTGYEKLKRVLIISPAHIKKIRK